MHEFWADVVSFLSSERLWSVTRATMLVIVGAVLAKLTSSTLTRLAGNRPDSHRTTLLKRGSYYLILVLFLISALRELGFNLSVLLGAACFWWLNAPLAPAILSVSVPQPVKCFL